MQRFGDLWNMRKIGKNFARGASTQGRNSMSRAIASNTELSSGIQRQIAGGTSVNKYGARKTEIDGITFASKHEAERYIELKYLQRIGFITDLQLQRKFTLIGAQKGKKGELLERPVTYVADFAYKDSTGTLVVEDAKSEATKTAAYKIKRKLMLSIYGIRIREV